MTSPESRIIAGRTALLSRDALDLARFGYVQQLHRRLGAYASFAAGFSFISILTTVFQLFAFGFSFGGPAFFWTWPAVFAGQFLVALNFAELAANYPISGCIYQWSHRMSNGSVGWFAGWMMLIGHVVSVAAAAIALQAVLPAVWSGFQLVPGSSSLTSAPGATNAVVLGSILIGMTTLVTAIGIRVMSLVNSIGVTCELIGVALLVALLLKHAERGPGIVLHSGGTSEYGGHLWAFLASALMAAYVMYGFDSAGELSEETLTPRRTAPRAILKALAAAGVGGALLLLAALMAAPSVSDGTLASQGLSYVLTSQLDSWLGRLLLADVAIAIVVCTLAIQTAGTRLAFSMARDRVLPCSRHLARVSTRTGTPVLPAILIGGLAVSILVLNIGQAQLFTVITSLGVVVVYLAYLFVTVPLLARRLRGWPARQDGTTPEDLGTSADRFRLGRAGVAVNAAAVGYGLAMTVNVAWPRAAVYDPEGNHWYLQWFVVLFVGGTAIIGVFAHRLSKTSRSLTRLARHCCPTGRQAAPRQAHRRAAKERGHAIRPKSTE